MILHKVKQFWLLFFYNSCNFAMRPILYEDWRPYKKSKWLLITTHRTVASYARRNPSNLSNDLMTIGSTLFISPNFYKARKSTKHLTTFTTNISMFTSQCSAHSLSFGKLMFCILCYLHQQLILLLLILLHNKFYYYH